MFYLYVSFASLPDITRIFFIYKTIVILSYPIRIGSSSLKPLSELHVCNPVYLVMFIDNIQDHNSWVVVKASST